MKQIDQNKNGLRTIILGVAALTFSLSASAFDCYSDCGKIASFTYPCPTFSNPGRKCQGREPTTFALCTSAKVAACDLLQPLEHQILHEIVMSVADDSHVQDAAKGWTTSTCAVAGAGLVAAVTAGYSAPICLAMNVAAAGCATFVAASSGVITGGVCAQLCTDRQLKDCR